MKNKEETMESFELTLDQIEKMNKCFGEAFTMQLPKKVSGIANFWGLDELTLIEYYSVNCLFTCHSTVYGDCVLKIFGCAYEWYITELRTLLEYDGNNHYVKVYDYDIETGAMLLERISPGTTLKKETSVDARIKKFIDVFGNAHIIPNNESFYETYLDTVEKAAKNVLDNVDIPELKKAAKEMIAACSEIFSLYPSHYLLHADLHGDNLLLDEHGNYTIVDPHGRIGPAICDLGRYIANEFGDVSVEARDSVVRYIVEQLSKRLSLPQVDIARVFFVDITLMTCWDSENGLVDCSGVIYALSLLNQKKWDYL